MNYYKEFIVTAEPFIPDVISSLLWELDITGINEEINCLKVFAGGDSSIDAKLISEQLNKLSEQKMLFSYNVEENILEEKNWNEEWEKNVNVIEVSDKIVIKPTFRDYTTKEGQIVLTIDPKMSFGTGEHQTTKLVLKMIEKYIRKNIKVLDVGSGTGVLAIAAVKLGADSAVAVDNDEWCFENAAENCRLNNVADKINVIRGEIKDVNEKQFGIVLANIQKNILLNIASDIKDKILKDGIVILSGLLFSDEKEIIAAYKKLGFEFLEMAVMDEWISIVMKKPDL